MTLDLSLHRVHDGGNCNAMQLISLFSRTSCIEKDINVDHLQHAMHCSQDHMPWLILVGLYRDAPFVSTPINFALSVSA